MAVRGGGSASAESVGRSSDWGQGTQGILQGRSELATGITGMGAGAWARASAGTQDLARKHQQLLWAEESLASQVEVRRPKKW